MIRARSVPANTIWLLTMTVLVGCSAIKYVPESEALYTGYEIRLEPQGRVRAKNRIKELMDQNVSPRPNTTILGMRPGVWFYYIAGPAEAKKSFRSFVKNKLGQVPVYMSDVNAERTANLIRGHLVNNGYFQAEVRYQTEVEGKKGNVTYTATVHRPYRLRNIDYPEDTRLFANIDSIKQESYLKENQRYNLERLQAEQARIEESLENYGYFFFDDRHLVFEADSTVGDRKIDLSLLLENGVPSKATRIYRIGSVTIYPDYTLMDDSLLSVADTFKIDGYNYIDRQRNYRPRIITDVVNLKQGNIYRRVDHEYTLSHLMSLGSFKFVNIKYEESASDSALLNARIYLTPQQKKSIRSEFQLTSKSNNFVGPGLNVSFTNRNFLRGSERFQIMVNTGYEVQVSRKIKQPLNAFELGVESSLSAPRFVTPFNIYYPSRKYLPTTDVKLGFRLQQRISYFRLNSANLAYGFTWRENTLKNHELFPVDISYMRLSKTSPEFRSSIRNNTFLRRSLEDQFIMGARYAFTLNTQVNQERQERFRERRYEKNHFYFNAKAESAGNFVQLLKGGDFRQSAESDSLETIFGSAYSQFVRGEIDFRHYYQFDERNMLASRLVAGAGLPFGNSITMPYIRQFSVGGSNSVRAFPARSIGPGTYNVRSDQQSENNILFLDQRGDLKIEGSVEFRFDINKLMKGALFFDAGNIWLWRDDTLRPGSKFNRKTFLDELAAGTGAGLRFDFNFFILRFDVAFPVRKPYLPDGSRWVWNEIDPRSAAWRRENLILNIAIGYPF